MALMASAVAALILVNSCSTPDHALVVPLTIEVD
jgi:hypothetical protein